MKFSVPRKHEQRKYRQSKPAKNCWVGKTWMSSCILCKFSSFSKENFSETIRYIGLKRLGDNWNCYALSIIGHFTLLALSDNDKHMLMRQKLQTRFAYRFWKFRSNFKAELRPFNPNISLRFIWHTYYINKRPGTRNLNSYNI